MNKLRIAINATAKMIIALALVGAAFYAFYFFKDGGAIAVIIG
jgi:hypothetical protein